MFTTPGAQKQCRFSPEPYWVFLVILQTSIPCPQKKMQRSNRKPVQCRSPQGKINQGWSLTIGQLKLCLCILMQGIPTEMGMGTLQACHLITERFHDSSKSKIAEMSHKNYAIFLVLYSRVFLLLLTQSLDTGQSAYICKHDS